ncbi:MAG: hypothetical protein PVH41_19445 [Anaerolineae bacterium]
MTQLHKRFADDQVEMLLKGYCQVLPRRVKVQATPGIGKTGLLALVNEQRHTAESSRRRSSVLVWTRAQTP